MKIKGYKNNHANPDKKAEVTIYNETKQTTVKKITRDKEEHSITAEGLIHQKDSKILRLYALSKQPQIIEKKYS